MAGESRDGGSISLVLAGCFKDPCLGEQKIIWGAAAWPVLKGRKSVKSPGALWFFSGQKRGGSVCGG